MTIRSQIGVYDARMLYFIEKKNDNLIANTSNEFINMLMTSMLNIRSKVIYKHRTDAKISFDNQLFTLLIHKHLYK